MRNVILGVLAFAVIGGVVTMVIKDQQSTPQAKRQKLLADFLGCVPDSLEDYHLEEISDLFETLWYRADRGKVNLLDVDSVMTAVEDYVEVGAIGGKELLHLMARVGYYTYKMDPRYNLPDGEVDHPTLNPNATMVTLHPESLSLEEFNEWMKSRKKEE